MNTMPDPNVLDMNELIDRIGGDEEFATELLHEFRENLDNEIAKLKETLDAQNPREVTEKSHSLKGSALNLSAKGFASIAKTIEHSSKDGDLATAERAFPDLMVEAEKLKEAIDSLS